MLCEETSIESSPEQRKAGTRPLREQDVPGASLNGRTPSSLKIPELKRWLLCRNASTRGKKGDLVLRYVSYVLLKLTFLFYTLPVGAIHSCFGLGISWRSFLGLRNGRVLPPVALMLLHSLFFVRVPIAKLLWFREWYSIAYTYPSYWLSI